MCSCSNIESESKSVIVADEECRRLDVFLAEKLSGMSRSRIGRLIRDGAVLVNGRVCKPSLPVELGVEIEVHIPPPPDETVSPEPIEFGVIHEDDAIVIIDKPPGLVVHCTSTMLSGTLVNGLMQRFKSISTVGGPLRRGIVHRLDKDTSGVMVVAKTDEAHIALMKQFENREVKKQYQAIVLGDVPERRKIDLPIERNQQNRQLMTARTGRGRTSSSIVEPIERFGGATVVCVRPKTGRTHQVRVHLSAIGHPVVADKQYGGRAMDKRPTFGMKRQALHASRLGFTHPESGEWVEFESPLPGDMLAAVELLRKG